MAMPVAVGAINVNSLNTNATVSVGENQLSGWSSHRKTNNGVGIQVGIFANSLNYTIILDNDLADAQMLDPDIIPGVQTQAL
ncbi:spore germination protein [Bacillus sp. ISL-18]|nr:spore germination protein [Bacillus sp. ISL-18]